VCMAVLEIDRQDGVVYRWTVWMFEINLSSLWRGEAVRS
jgi:hypothetical protein